MAPKKQKQSLADFLADETTGKVDWADDFDDLPAAPLPRADRGIPQRGSDWLSSMPDRADRDRSSGLGSERQSYPAREELPLPTQPPYTAFIGNLSFDVSEEDIASFFAPDQTTSVRLVTGGDGRAKGFGYVEFEALDGLKNALTKSGSQLAGRTARVSVAEPREAKGPAFSSVAEEATQWRRAGPLPPSSDGASGPGRRGGDRPGYNRFESSGGSSGFDNMDVVAGGGRSGFGSKFAPSAPREPRRNVEPLEPSQGDNASDWRTGKPVSEMASPMHSSRRPSASPAAAGAEGGRAPSFRRHGDATEVDEKYSNQERLGFGSKFVATPPDSPSVQKRSGFGFDRRNKDAAAAAPASAGDGADTWRSARRTSANGPASNGASKSAEGTSGEPAQRKKLELKPRSTPVGGDAPADAASSDKGNNPFGNARPVDASDRQREIEEKMAQREKEHKEEERKRREKQKSERGKSSDNGDGAARSNTVSNEKAVNGEGVKSPTTTAAATPKQPAPTGAWGGGRKPSGALAGNQEGSTEQSTNSDVDALTSNVEAVSVKDA
ncbi:RNA-binding domain-containing protein [Meira miltonrushii]|uniref:RNA-binding domain-containing protein n=1 Tax=Meira miltonrushii TaxID=1280837 RepID=A0A316VAM0_9BASI|nr:RNA-binding domain-containing protein [Meira miltonrushii]PWN34128.1 RNA-binding domain-containing protein [Meira miltonrushii]